MLVLPRRPQSSFPQNSLELISQQPDFVAGRKGFVSPSNASVTGSGSHNSGDTTDTLFTVVRCGLWKRRIISGNLGPGRRRMNYEGATLGSLRVVPQEKGHCGGNGAREGDWRLLTDPQDAGRLVRRLAGEPRGR